VWGVGGFRSDTPAGDERQCLILIAAAQANDVARFEAYLRWLARTELRPALAIAARALGTALKLHDLCLPNEEGDLSRHVAPGRKSKDPGDREAAAILADWLSRRRRSAERSGRRRLRHRARPAQPHDAAPPGGSDDAAFGGCSRSCLHVGPAALRTGIAR
jgi:hypothetical protein